MFHSFPSWFRITIRSNLIPRNENHEVRIRFDIGVSCVNNHFSLTFFSPFDIIVSSKMGRRVVSIVEISRTPDEIISFCLMFQKQRERTICLKIKTCVYRIDLTIDGTWIIISDVKMSTDFFTIKTDWLGQTLICFCIATKFVLCHKIWSWTKTLQPINHQIDSINFFLPKISSDGNMPI